MLTKMSVKQFVAVPYLESSVLLTNNAGTLQFSTTKPSVIVGPNGSGKSALLSSLALRFLALYSGQSSFDNNYVIGQDSADYWTQVGRWGHDYAFLQGLDCTTDNAPVLYYRPGHIPGNDHSVTAAMMCGYFNQAKEYGELIKHKSSGQGNLALLAKLHDALSGVDLPSKYECINWRFGKEARDLKSACNFSGANSFDYQAEILKNLFVPQDNVVPLILMDEPEQSLDALAEVQLWNAIANADCTKMQIITATHSLYPLMHPDKFEIIEAVPGFKSAVLALLEQ